MLYFTAFLLGWFAGIFFIPLTFKPEASAFGVAISFMLLFLLLFIFSIISTTLYFVQA